MNGINKKNSKVSVLLPVYNGAEYLEFAIASILNQSYKDFEFLIINDGSTDNSEKIINSFSDDRIVYIKNECNLGLIKTLNKGLKIVKGDYIVRMDQDDISLPNRIESQVFFMDNNPDCGVCGTWIKTFGEVTRKKKIKYSIDPEVIKAELMFFNPIAHPSVMIRKFFLDKYKLFYDDFFKNSEDYELWLRGSGFFKIYNLPKVLLYYRISSGQMTKKYQDSQNEMMKIIKSKAIEPFSKFLTKEEIELYKSIGSYDSQEVFSFLVESEKLLIKIIEINKNINEFDNKIFEKVVSKVYYNLLLKNIKLKNNLLNKLLFSIFSKNISFLDKVKFIIKYFFI